MQSTEAQVVSSRREGVAVLTINRPERRNAMNSSTVDELLAELGVLAADDDISGVVITGAGGVFSAGADLSEDLTPQAASARMARFCRLYETLLELPKVTVAAIEGPAVGGGAEVAATCDLRVGSHSARIRFPGAQLGIPIGSARLPLLVGLSHAKDLLLTSRFVDAEDAYRMGFLNRLVPEEGAAEEAITLISEVARQPDHLLQKRALNESEGVLMRTRTENRSVMRSQVRR